MRRQHAPARRRLARLACLALLLPGCDDRPTASAARVAPAPLQLEVGGCVRVERGGRCGLDPETRRLTLWCAEAAALTVASEGRPVPVVRRAAVDDGTKLVVDVPAEARTLEVCSPESGGCARLQLGEAPALALRREVADLHARGAYAAARALLAPRAHDAAASARDVALSLLARVELADGRVAEARDVLRQSLEVAYQSGCVSCASQDATALAYVLTMDVHDYAAARAVLDELAAHTEGDAAARALIPHYRGLIALQVGDLRAALAQFRDAKQRLARLDLLADAALAASNESTTLALLGRHDEALALTASLTRAAGASACEQLDPLQHLMWLGIGAQVTPDSPLWTAVAAAAREEAATAPLCPDPWRQRNHLINQGLLALAARDLPAATAAHRALARSEPLHDVALTAWQHELAGRVQLARGRADAARAAFARAREVSRSAGLWEGELRANAGIGRAFELRGARAQAVAAYAENEALLARLIDGIPFGEGLQAFLRERDGSTQRLVALLVALGKPAAALEVARAAHARPVRALALVSRMSGMDAPDRARWERAIGAYYERRTALEQAEAALWQLPRDRLQAARDALGERRRALLESLDAMRAELAGPVPPARPRSPSPSEPTLALVDDGRGAIGFWQRGHAVRAVQLAGARDPGQVAQRFLDRIGAQLAGVQRLRALLTGAYANVDLHALTLAGEPLIERAAVRYALDAPDLARHAPEVPRALLVIDPTGDLAHARDEGRSVRAALSGERARVLEAGAATRAEVLGELGRASLLHYAGHAQYAGRDGTASGLRLADGWISIGDLLAAQAVPPLVVLSACEGAAAASGGDATGIGVAEAFVASGAGAVVAATRPVADVTARRLFELFYAARTQHPAHDPARWLAEAQRQLRRARPADDWASFRALTP